MQSKSVLVLANRQFTGLVFPVAGTGNHAHWLLGHLVFSEVRYREMTEGIVNPCESIQDKFGGGSQPDPNATG